MSTKTVYALCLQTQCISSFFRRLANFISCDENAYARPTACKLDVCPLSVSRGTVCKRWARPMRRKSVQPLRESKSLWTQNKFHVHGLVFFFYIIRRHTARIWTQKKFHKSMDLCFFTLSVCILHTFGLRKNFTNRWTCVFFTLSVDILHGFGLRKNFTSPWTCVFLHCPYAYCIHLDLEKISQVLRLMLFYIVCMHTGSIWTQKNFHKSF